MAVDGPRSTLAKSLKIIFEDISHRGICYERIQNTIGKKRNMPLKNMTSSLQILAGIFSTWIYAP